jgi:hypothetical protein
MFKTICQWLSFRSSAQVIAFLVSFLASSIKFGLIVFAAGYVITLLVSSHALLYTRSPEYVKASRLKLILAVTSFVVSPVK